MPVIRASRVVSKRFKLPKNSFQWRTGCCQATSPAQAYPYNLEDDEVMKHDPCCVEEHFGFLQHQLSILLSLSFSSHYPHLWFLGPKPACNMLPESWRLWVSLTCHYSVWSSNQAVPAERLQAAGLSGVIHPSHVASKLFPLLPTSFLPPWWRIR